MAGDLKFKFKFGFEIEFEFKLEGFLKCFLKKCLGSPCYLMVVSGGSFFLGAEIRIQGGVFFGVYKFPAVRLFCSNEAKFVLITKSAFISYQTKMAENGC